MIEHNFRNYLNMGVLALSLYSAGCGRNNNFVERVIDGDTIVLKSGEHVRLIGENTPERGKKGFKEAKKRLEELVLYKEVQLEVEKRDKDKYGRPLRDVYIDGIFVNELMIEEGYAVVEIIRPNNKYEKVLKKARERHLGTHSKGKCDKPY
jgi:micrococcal nuclease